MTPRATDLTEYKLNVVSFSVVREPGYDMPGRGRPERAKLDQPEVVAALARQIIADDAKEHFWVLLLDTQNRLVAAHHVSTGTLSASLVSPREVFAPALRVMGVASLILIHNHPSGDPTPSREDLSLTRQLVEAGRLLDIRVHDHVVVGSGNKLWVSLAHRGQL